MMIGKSRENRKIKRGVSELCSDLCVITNGGVFFLKVNFSHQIGR